MKLIEDPKIREDVEVVMRDPVFQSWDLNMDGMSWPRFEKGFPGLVRIVHGQQLSTRAADKLWEKTIKAAGAARHVTAQWVLSQDEEQLKTLGFSRQKRKTIRILADRVDKGDLDLRALDTFSDRDVIETLTACHGLGLWSAQIYLMFALARPNIFPRRDLAADRGVMMVFDLKEVLSYEASIEVLKPWDGRLTAFTLVLWQIYTRYWK